MRLGFKLTDHIVLHIGWQEKIWIKAKLKLKHLGKEVGSPALEEQTAVDGSGRRGRCPRTQFYLVTSLLISRYF